MKNFYVFLFTFCLSFSLQAQLSKPLYPPSKEKVTFKNNINPISSNLIGIPKAKPSIIQSFKPSTLPILQRKLKDKNLKIIENSKNGQPIMINGLLNQQSAGRSLDLQVYDYLEAIKNPILVKSPNKEFDILEQKTDDLGQTHFKLQQKFKGITVYGGQVWLHAQKDKVNLFNGRNYPTPSLENVSPSITKETAQIIANQDVSLTTKIKPLKGLEQKLIGEEKAPELVIYHPTTNKKTAYLAWHLKFHANVSSEWEYFIDAHSGEVIEAYKTLCQLHHKSEKYLKKLKEAEKIPQKKVAEPYLKIKNALPENGPATSNATDLNNFNRTVHSYDINGDFFLIDASRPMYNSSRSSLPNDPIGAIWTINAQNTYPENSNFEVVHLVTGNNNWNDPISVSAHHNAGEAYDYFRNTFGRNSINGNGGTIVSIINVADEDGSGLDNAFWSGSAMFYGNGKQAFGPLAKALDVAGHEIAHGVIQNTANLRYQGESGAMNESFADVFGVLIDRDDYQLGEDVVNTNVFRSGALRDMIDPHNGGTRLGDPGYQPSHVNEQFFGQQDNGGVHINSGITNRAFFLIANTIGKAKAEQIYYRALSTYLVNTSQFVDLRVSLLQAATDIHGGNSNEVSIVAQAFDAVGVFGSDVGQGSQSGGETDIEVDPNPGQDFIVYTDNNNSKLYVADGTGEPLTVFSEEGVRSRPSITDDGEIIVFVGLDNRIYAILIDWSPAEPTFEQITVQDQPIWRNAAISRQGNLIAALEDEVKNTIDIFDLEKEDLRTFELYNPTFTEGISTGEIQYADVIEFDFSGEFVLYDAQNEIRGDFGGDNISYWDIGFIKVYDNSFDSYETDVNNNIFKLFAGLPENVSIGNPTFSKNSPNIIAYEYIDAFNTLESGEQIYELRGLNLSNNNENTIFSSLNLQVPNYSRLDDRIIFNFLDDNNSYNIAQIEILEDKISPASEDGSFLIQQAEGAQLGVWFSDGTRALTAVNELEKSVEDFQISPNPFEETLAIQFNLDKRKDLIIELYNNLGQRQLHQSINANSGFNHQEIDTKNLPAGAYFISLKSEEGIISKKVIRSY